MRVGGWDGESNSLGNFAEGGSLCQLLELDFNSDFFLAEASWDNKLLGVALKRFDFKYFWAIPMGI